MSKKDHHAHYGDEGSAEESEKWTHFQFDIHKLDLNSSIYAENDVHVNH